jgi:hypothetical protein
MMNVYLNETLRTKFNLTEQKLLEAGFTMEEVAQLNKQISPPRIRRDAAESGDLQYVEHDLRKKLKHLAETTCLMINNHADELERLITTSPTNAMRLLLNRTNLIATTLSSEIVEINFCHELKPDEYRLLPNPNNCSIPVQLKANGQIWYLDQQTHELYRDTSKIKDDECDQILFVQLEGTLWTFDRATGRLTKTHETPLSNKTATENWDFLNRETIINDIPIRDAQEAGLQEEILAEIEKTAEGFAEVVKEDQTEPTSTTAEEDLLGAFLDRYFLKIWRIWVSLICAAQTYAIVSAVKQRMEGNNPQFLQHPFYPLQTPQMQAALPTQNPQRSIEQRHAHSTREQVSLRPTASYRRDNETVHLQIPKWKKKWYQFSRNQTKTQEEMIPLQEINTPYDDTPTTSRTMQERPRSTVGSLFTPKT